MFYILYHNHLPPPALIEMLYHQEPAFCMLHAFGRARFHTVPGAHWDCG